MDYSGASAYVYAKASGMIGKAFAGQNAERLFAVKSLAELWGLLFESEVPSVPEVMLANRIEKDAHRLFVKQYLSLLDIYEKPSRFLVDLIRRYEVGNLKQLTSALSLGEKPHTPLNLGKYAVFNYKAWPDIRSLTHGTEFAWCNTVPAVDGRAELAHKLDIQEFKILWRDLNAVPGDAGQALLRYFQHEYSILNMIWALRLRVYYKMTRDQIVPHLLYAADSALASDPICAYAWEVLDRSLDVYEEWKSWKFAALLNPHEEGAPWKIDPMWLEQKARIAAAHKTRKVFHRYPMTDVSLAMFFRIKQQELNCIRAAAECIRLNADKTEAMYVAGLAGETQ